MTRVLVAAGLLTALSAQPGWAQSADDCVRSALNIPEAKYPCVYPALPAAAPAVRLAALRTRK